MRRRVGLFLIFGAVLPLAAASVAWACGILATMKIDTKVAQPGQTVTATGKNYGTAAGVSAVSIRLKSRSGEVLATAVPATGGKIESAVKLPDNISPGYYTLLATQTNANGTPKSGTPGRTSLRIQGTARRGSGGAVVSPWSTSNPSGPSGTGAPVATDGGGQPVLPTVLAVVFSLSMLAAGWTLVGRRKRTVAGPQLGV